MLRKALIIACFFAQQNYVSSVAAQHYGANPSQISDQYTPIVPQGQATIFSSKTTTTPVSRRAVEPQVPLEGPVNKKRKWYKPSTWSKKAKKRLKTAGKVAAIGGAAAAAAGAGYMGGLATTGSGRNRIKNFFTRGQVSEDAQ